MDYKLCTLEQLADYVETSPCSRITQQLMYYKKTANSVMIEKIVAARAAVRKRKLIKLLETL